MKQIWIGACLALLAGPAWAHGDHGTGQPQGVERQDSWWLDLVPRAAAAQRMEIDERQGVRFIRADGLPNHATGAFPNRDNPNRISAQSYSFRVPLKPVMTGHATYYRPNHLFGVAVNGVVFDPNTAEYWNNDRRAGWMMEALSGARPLGIDRNNAHVQPDGSYHYHGVPTGLVESLGGGGRPVLVGWAADGFAIYVDPAARPGWRLKPVRDPGGPGGRPDGTYARDYAYVRGAGNLDECNGREGVTAEFPEGAYYYVVTAQFPYVPRCFMGVADTSFLKRGGPPPGGAMGGPMRGPGGRQPPPPR
ncbi:YHYH protein [Reyranella sp.]|uniref:YHYH protein n=1 Tax=Reyranella sp. TaxID=1929291 RepID=UPI003BA87068